MSYRPTLEHVRLAGLELDGRPIEITSAELVWLQYWNGDEPAQREWELNGRTFDPNLRDGTQSCVLVLPDRRLKGRVVVSSSRSDGYAAFQGVGLGELVEVPPTG